MNHYLAVQTIYVAVWVVLAFIIGYGLVRLGIEFYLAIQSWIKLRKR